MTYEDFISQPGFLQLEAEAKELKTKRFSDIVDKNGYQAVDLVQEGGGVLGIAWVGYTSILEAAAIRFFHLAGTSAGAIDTSVLACMESVDREKSKEVLDIVARQELLEFVNGAPVLKNIVHKIIDGTRFKKLLTKMLWNLRKIKQASFVDLGLNPGHECEKWLDNV